VDEQQPKPWYAHLPAKLAAVVVFLVAVTTLIGNVVELAHKRTAPAAQPAAPAERGPRAAGPSSPANRELRLDRIVVLGDGSPGTTDWRFSVEVDGEPVLSLRQDGLDDGEGANVAIPGAATRVDVEGRGASIRIEGWRGSWFSFGDAPDVVGEGWLPARGEVGQVRVSAPDPEAGAFVFHFSTAP
jgi:hypothetical protein